MAKRGELLSVEQREYRRLAKQVNQRMVRLERYLAENPYAPRSGLSLYQYYLKENYGISERTGQLNKKRFPENPSKLSPEQLQEYTVQLSNLSNTELTRVAVARKYEPIYRVYLERKAEDRNEVLTGAIRKLTESASNLSRMKGIENKVLRKGDKIANPDEFFNQLHIMHRYKLDKVIGYRDAMRLLVSVQNRPAASVQREIASIAGDFAEKKKLTYREVKQRFERL